MCNLQLIKFGSQLVASKCVVIPGLHSVITDFLDELITVHVPVTMGLHAYFHDHNIF